MSALVRTARDFRVYITHLVADSESHGVRSLEEYLRTLYGNLIVKRGTAASYEVVANSLRDAFQAEAVPFDETWATRRTPPRNPWFVPPDFPQFRFYARPDDLASLRNRTSDFAVVIDTLQFQIADLRSISSKQRENKWRYLGVTSPGGNDWYNWDPYLYLERGTAGLLTHLEAGHLVDSDNERCNWATVAFLLEMGRVWE